MNSRRETTTRGRTVLLALLLAFTVACDESDPGRTTPDAGPTPVSCERREDCEGGQVCTQDGVCGPCDSSGQCRLKERCDEETRTCLFRDGWGTECTTNDDCTLGAWCRQGLCRPRSEVTLCPTGTKAECPEGQRCDTRNLVCEEDLGCVEDGDCDAEELCNVGLHACVPRCTDATASQVCEEGERCAQGRCVRCTEDAECGAGLVCDEAGRCVATERCYSDRDCEVPLVCHIPSGLCLQAPPPCTSDDGCGQDERCEVSTGTCVPRTCQPDALEPNDAVTTAYSVNASRYEELTLCPGDIDHFSITLERGDQLGVNVEADVYAEPVFTTMIQDANGRTLASGRFLATHVAAGAGTYTVRISATDPTERPYDVGFFLSRGTPCDDDAREPNDTPESATPMAPGTSQEGMLCPQDRDHFRFTVPEGQGAKVSLSGYVAASGLLRLCLLDGSTELGCSADPAGASVTVPASPTGSRTLTARVTGDDARTMNGYTLQVESRP